MIFEKNGVKYDVTDPAHIDCFKAKGWKQCIEKKPKPTVKEKPKKKG